MPEPLRTLVLLVGISVLLGWIVWFGRQRSARAKRNADGLSLDSLDSAQRLQRAMEQLQVNVMEFARDAEARLDTKITTLNRLIIDADQRIKSLDDLAKSLHARNSSALSPLHREVYRLADEGLDNIEIARRTSIAPGEVELLLTLRKDRHA